jgi:hypothetical protein
LLLQNDGRESEILLFNAINSRLRISVRYCAPHGHEDKSDARIGIAYSFLEELHMSRRSKVLFASIFVFLVAAHQAQAQTTIKFSCCGQPTSPSAGTITGSGSFTVATGYSATSVVLFAELTPAPGQGGQSTVKVDSCNNTFVEGQITGLPSGDYNVFARITVTNSCSQTLYFDSAIVKVTVK